MNSKRQKLFKKIPFDCWCEIIKFFHLPTDLFSLLLVVKGFYEYLNNHATNSTKNIKFCLPRIPRDTNNIVSQLHFSNRYAEDVGEKVLKKLGSSSLRVVFHRIFLRFPNLSSFKFSISELYGKPQAVEKLRRLLQKDSSLESCGIFSSVKLTNIFSPCQFLKKLNLTFFETELHINHSFPKLEILVLFRFGEVKRPVLGNENLIINWKKLPSLRTCHLTGWVVKSFSTENVNILKRLDELKLDNTDSNEISLERDEKEVMKDLKSIKNLIIEDLSLRHFRKITNLSTETLSLGCGNFLTFHRINENLSQLTSIVNMPFLTTLRIENEYGRFRWGEELEDEEEVINIRHLPVLSKVILRCLSFRVSFKHVPSLQHIDVYDCPYSFEIDIKESPLVEFLSLDDSFFLSLIKWVNAHKKLRIITLSIDLGDYPDYDEISFSDFPLLESVNVDISLKSFSNCPKLKKVDFYEPSVGYSGFLTPINHLERFVVKSLENKVLSETFFGQFLENVKMIDFVRANVFGKEMDNVYFDICNIRNIREFHICNVKEFEINGDCSDEAVLEVLVVNWCPKVVVTGVVSLKKILIKNVSSEVIIRNCKNLENIEIVGGRGEKEKEYGGLKIILEDLLELKSLKIFKAEIRELVTRNIREKN